MGREIERKFLVRDDGWRREADDGLRVCQGYIETRGCSVRVRIRGEQGLLTLKGPSVDAARDEYEYSIPLEDAREILERYCLKPPIEKTRHLLSKGLHVWEIDVFHGLNEGLVLAEVELENPGEEVDLPSWIGREVTADERYHNASLARRPYATWPGRSPCRTSDADRPRS